MQIVALEARHIRVPLVRAVKHASHTRKETDNIVVRCMLSDGSIGWGEGVPRDYVTGETIDSCMQTLRAAISTLNFDICANFADAVRSAERMKLRVPDDDRDCRANAARCALELAVLDAFGRAFNEPLMNVVKILEPELWNCRGKVRYSGIVLSSKVWKSRLFTRLQRWYGLNALKVKVGVAGANDPARLRAIRRAAGADMSLRVDANEAWSPQDAAQKIRDLAPFGIDSFEQPVSHENATILNNLRKETGAKIMLDESLCSEIDAERAIANKWCDYFNLRLSKCGGFIPTLRLAALAKRHGIGSQLGCQVGETGILSAAGRHFAASVSGLLWCEGSYDRRLVRENLTRQDVSFCRGGWAAALTGSGLGVDIDPARVDSITIRREVIFG